MEAKQRLKATRNVSNVERVAAVLGSAGLLAFLLRYNTTPRVVKVVRRPKPLSLPNALAALGTGYLLYIGATGKDPVDAALGIRRARVNQREGIQVVKGITINRPKDEVYAFWRDFSNLGRFMEHLERVDLSYDGGSMSHWVAKLPLGQRAEWDAEIVEDVPGQLIRWQSVPGSRIETEGSVTFTENMAGQGTEVLVSMMYDTPAKSFGSAVLKLFGEEPAQQVQDDLRRLKELLETGEISTVYGQTSGRLPQVRKQRAGMLQQAEEHEPLHFMEDMP